ncbi:hypothetical protein, partial [Acinetobacter lwoffii]|uniref:hypothetical protein n=1 Tax=Acinetobacter lwoffii TaxID=28090 RepID=UPI0021CDA1EE
MLIVLNKGVPHLDWLAKYTAAFFNMSLPIRLLIQLLKQQKQTIKYKQSPTQKAQQPKAVSQFDC